MILLFPESFIKHLKVKDIFMCLRTVFRDQMTLRAGISGCSFMWAWAGGRTPSSWHKAVFRVPGGYVSLSFWHPTQWNTYTPRASLSLWPPTWWDTYSPSRGLPPFILMCATFWGFSLLLGHSFSFFGGPFTPFIWYFHSICTHI